jgi:hypothetical protein
MEDQEQPDEADAVLLHQGLNFPVDITEWVLEEPSDILECSPLLSHITRLPCGLNKLSEIAISLLCESSISRVSKRLKYYLPIMSALSLMLGTPNMRP